MQPESNVVNLRRHAHLGGAKLKELNRVLAYQQAGADGVFVPGLTDRARIAELVASLDVPLNLLYSPMGPTVDQLADLGVRRVSLGSLLYRRALGAVLETVAEIREGSRVQGSTPSYGDVMALSRRG